MDDLVDAYEADAHDRTSRFADTLGVRRDRLQDLRGWKVGVEIGDDALDDSRACLAFLTLVNLLARLGPWLPCLSVHAPPHGLVPASRVYREGGPLEEEALLVAGQAGPAGDNRRGPYEGGTLDLVISIGTPSLPARQYIVVSCEGGAAVIEHGANRPVRQRMGEAPMLSWLAGAALGCAAVHRQACLMIGVDLGPPYPKRVVFNPFTLDEGTGRPILAPELPRALLLGAGGIGLQVAYADAVNAGARLHGTCLDDGKATRTSSNRLLSLPYDRAASGTVLKAHEAERLCPGLQGAEARYEAWRDADLGAVTDFGLAVTTIDNLDGRRAIARDLPRVLLDAATGGLGMSLTRASAPGRTCGACAFPRIEEDEVTISSRQLGLDPTLVEDLVQGRRALDDGIFQRIRAHGRVRLTEDRWREVEARGWPALQESMCGEATIAPEAPGASISYASALAAFILMAQIENEAAARPVLGPGREQWIWDNVLRPPPGAAGFQELSPDPSCEPAHAVMLDAYHALHAAQADAQGVAPTDEGVDVEGAAAGAPS